MTTTTFLSTMAPSFRLISYKRMDVQTAAHGRVEWVVQLDDLTITLRTRWAARAVTAAACVSTEVLCESLRDVLDDRQAYYPREVTVALAALQA
jgi:hypothetical protein